MTDTRLIERWLPIAELGVESTRERTPMTPFPAPNRLHVWWARRPLVAARAAVLASLLPADADRERFLHVLGIHGDPVAARSAIEKARRTGIRVKDPYGYDRAFGYLMDQNDRAWLKSTLANGTKRHTVLDPTAGGGSIPLEAIRIGLTSLANDLNPVAALIMRATVEWPSGFSENIKEQFNSLATEWRRRIEKLLNGLFPKGHLPDQIDQTYLWARTIKCPYCDGSVPLSPNWRLAPDGTGVRLKPNLATGSGTPGRVCSFEIVQSAKEQSSGTVARGAGTCPYSDCGRVIDGDEIKTQAQAGHMGEQLYTVVYKKRIVIETKSGKTREKWVREYRAPHPEDENTTEIQAMLCRKAAGVGGDGHRTERAVPATVSNDDRNHYNTECRSGAICFSPRQLTLPRHKRRGFS